jgi:UDP-N-acetylmuramyl pentapeptide phosphotransferase/UDP-N-acetylglucosamine-1-phosphate transferase
LRALSSDKHRAVPNDRSMHKQPTPVGGGLAIIAALCATVALWKGPLTSQALTVLLCAAGLSLISALDHYRPLWPLTRFAAQTLAVAVMLSLVPETQRFIATLPWWLERVGLAVAWLWLINLTNFMDGIDGIAGAEAATVAVGVAAVLAGHLAQSAAFETALAIAVAGSCLGYLIWNWAPARIFMGDAGSIPLGFLLGWLLLDLATRGAWAAALALPLLFVSDATITLLKRLISGAKPWTPHRTHFYQRAVSGTATPPHVVGLMTACNAVIIVLALQAAQRPVATLAASLGVAALFLAVLSHWAKPAQANG